MFIPHGLTRNVSKQDNKMLHAVRELICNAMDYYRAHPKMKGAYEVNCHIITRAIAMCIKELTVVNGNYMGLAHSVNEKGEKFVALRHCTHSWLVTPDGAILEAYGVGAIPMGGATAYSD